MRNVNNCNNCLYSETCEETGIKTEEGCFNHSSLDLESGKITEVEWEALWEEKHKKGRDI